MLQLFFAFTVHWCPCVKSFHVHWTWLHLKLSQVLGDDVLSSRDIVVSHCFPLVLDIWVSRLLRFSLLTFDLFPSIQLQLHFWIAVMHQQNRGTSPVSNWLRVHFLFLSVLRKLAIKKCLFFFVNAARRHHCRNCGGLVCDDCSRTASWEVQTCRRWSWIPKTGFFLGPARNRTRIPRDLSLGNVWNSTASHLFSQSFWSIDTSGSRRPLEPKKTGQSLRWLLQDHRRPPCKKTQQKSLIFSSLFKAACG